jgi:hypothetical protein
VFHISARGGGLVRPKDMLKVSKCSERIREQMYTSSVGNPGKRPSQIHYLLKFQNLKNYLSHHYFKISSKIEKYTSVKGMRWSFGLTTLILSSR